jgi:hypothetical protein
VDLLPVVLRRATLAIQIHAAVPEHSGKAATVIHGKQESVTPHTAAPTVAAEDTTEVADHQLVTAAAVAAAADHRIQEH